MNQLGLFAKFWQPGTVKTRLAASIGDHAACELYQVFVFHLMHRLHDAADQRTVVFSPRESELEFRKSIPPHWKLCPQSAGDLGTRMESYFRDQFGAASTHEQHDDSVPDKIVIIGADCPQLDSRVIRSAFELLDEAPVVIGPSTDGGYYLIAMKNHSFEIFSDIEWSTGSVFARTAQRLNEQQIRFLTLPPLTDVDDLDSLMALKSELEIRAAGQPELATPGSSGQGSSALDELDLNLLEGIRTAVSGPILESK